MQLRIPKRPTGEPAGRARSASAPQHSQGGQTVAAGTTTVRAYFNNTAGEDAALMVVCHGVDVAGHR
jgi:hypothetical protein